MRLVMLTLLALSMIGSHVPSAPAKEGKTAKKDARVAERKQVIDAMAKATLDKLFAASKEAKQLSEKAVGCAVFDNTKVAIGISGGGGKGVAVDKATGSRTYMKMGTVGIGLGLGGQSYQVVFLFETKESLGGFVDKGWQADAAATAAAGKEGVNAESTFKNGVAVFQMTEAGLMAAADVSGTKYWKNDELN